MHATSQDSTMGQQRSSVVTVCWAVKVNVKVRGAPLLCPRPVGGAGALSGDRRPSFVCPSVCMSDVAFIGSNSKTKRPRKTKLCTGVPQVTHDSHTDFKVKRSKVKVGRGHIVAAT